MHLADNFIKEKFLQDIQIFFRYYHIEESDFPLGALIRNWVYTDSFHNRIFDLYIRHYKRNLTILEKLAAKENLETKRQVFNLVREHISKENITLTLPSLTNLYISHTFGEIIQHP